MSSTYSPNINPTTEEIESSATGSWTKSFTRRFVQPSLIAVNRALGIVFTMMVSPATAIPDMWYMDRRRRLDSSVVWAMQIAVGRPISRAEALQIAQSIIEQAEQERLDIDNFEAIRGIQWEE